MAGEWEDVSMGDLEGPIAKFLESKGLARYATKIIDATDAETMEDLKLIDAAMVEEVIKAADLKLVSAKKFRLAMAELRGEQVKEEDAGQSRIGDGDTDAAASTTPVPAPAQSEARPAPQECIAVCIDRSGSMGSPFAEVTLNVVKGAVAERTRMEAVKAMFYAFRDRVESVGKGSYHIGLLQFDNCVERMLDLTPRLDRFEAIVDDMKQRGQTAIYSAIIEGVSMLEKHFDADSQMDLRVLVLTDGQNNAGASPEEALQAAGRIGAVVDAIIVGSRPDANLRKIVSATGGECYQICDLGEGFELLEAEGVVSLLARRGGVEKPPFQPRQLGADLSCVEEKTMIRGGAVQRVAGPTVDFATKRVVDVANVGDTAAQANTSNSASVKRLLKELRDLSTGATNIWMNSGEGVHIFPAPENLNYWRALIEGPPGSPFEDGVFMLNVVVPEQYPFKAPKITFETPIYHCNVSDSGQICLDILQDHWNPALSIPKCLEAIRLMLKEPNPNDAVRQWIAELTLAYQKSNGADARYYENARERTRLEASLSVADWRQKWGC